MVEQKTIIETTDLVKTFPGAEALKGLNIKINNGTITGLIGPNGSGKSTLLKILSGLQYPTTGEVRVFGHPVNRQTKERIAFLPELNHLYDWMSVNEALDFYSYFYQDWNSDVAGRLLGFMNIKETVKVKNLSKGMTARLKLVITMARSAPLVLLDEPFSGIDPQSRTRILEAIVTEYKLGEQTVILATHYVLEAEKIFDQVIMLEDGRIKMMAEADELRMKYNSSIQDLLKEVYE